MRRRVLYSLVLLLALGLTWLPLVANAPPRALQGRVGAPALRAGAPSAPVPVGGSGGGFAIRTSALLQFVEAVTYGGGVSGVTTYVTDIHVLSNSCSYVVGHTKDPTLTTDGYQTAISGGGGDRFDAFVLFVDRSFGVLHGTFFGGQRDEWARGVAVDENGSVWLVGTTDSSEGEAFPLTGDADQAVYGHNLDAYAAKFSPTLSTLEYSTYLGGDGVEKGFDVAVDESDYSEEYGGSVWLVGSVSNANLPAAGTAYDSSFNGGNRDAFVAALAPGSTWYTTYLGGAGDESATGIVMTDATEPRAGIVVQTDSSDYPMVSAFDSVPPTSGACWALTEHVLDHDPAAPKGFVNYSTYLGNGGLGNSETALHEFPRVAYDSPNNVYGVAGTVLGSNFPITQGSASTLNRGGEDGYVAVLAGPGENGAGGSDLQASSYLGGSSADYLWSCDFSSRGELLVGGSTRSGDFPVIGRRAEGKDSATKRDAVFARWRFPGDGTCELNFSSSWSSDAWDSIRAVASDPRSDDIRACGVASPADVSVISGVLASYVLPTEPLFDLVSSNIREINETGQEVEVILNATSPKSSLLGSDVSHIDVVFFHRDESVEEVDGADVDRDDDFPEIYTVTVEVNESTVAWVGVYAVTRDNGRSGVTQATNLTVGALPAGPPWEGGGPSTAAEAALWLYGWYILTGGLLIAVLVGFWYLKEFAGGWVPGAFGAVGLGLLLGFGEAWPLIQVIGIAVYTFLAGYAINEMERTDGLMLAAGAGLIALAPVAILTGAAIWWPIGFGLSGSGLVAAVYADDLAGAIPTSWGPFLGRHAGKILGVVGAIISLVAAIIPLWPMIEGLITVALPEFIS